MERVTKNLQRYWGYESFRPMQEDAVTAVLDRRDLLCVLPTGGGKSICYQAPATVMDGVALVISPLIALMKDQVDGLTTCGIPAACVHSGLSESERRQTWDRLQAGELKLLYVTPERLMQERFLGAMHRIGVSYVAVDEAHCVSEWGHDFRPEYRSLGQLKELLPGSPIHAFTATATQRVQEDICKVLALEEPVIYIGQFDRPNLVYHVRRRDGLFGQVTEIVDRFENESGIIYCLRRKDVDSLADQLVEKGYSAAPYHAGLDDATRVRNQDAFIKEDVRIVVATIAFGMGIDKPDVRFVIHTGMPKSVENYQQESGRAGRDGLPAECHLLYSEGDMSTLRFMTRDLEGEAAAAAEQKLQDVMSYATGATCRHHALSNYFAQRLLHKKCDACDVCLGMFASVDGADDLACAVIEGVMSLDQRYGAMYVAEVLSGSTNLKVVERGDDRSPVHGRLKEHRVQSIRRWIDELCDQGFLQRVGEYNIIKVTAEGTAFLDGEGAVRLSEPSKKKPRKSPAAETLNVADRDLFEALRAVRRKLAQDRDVPPYVIFGDKTLRALAEMKPTTHSELLNVYGIGERKAEDLGETFIAAIREYLGLDTPADPREDPQEANDRKHDQRAEAYRLYADAWSPEDVANTLRVPSGKALKWLIEYIDSEFIDDASAWVSPPIADSILDVSLALPNPKASRVKEALDGAASDRDIKIVLACMRNC